MASEVESESMFLYADLSSSGFAMVQTVGSLVGVQQGLQCLTHAQVMSANNSVKE